jgi:4-alpha-glucanotransferase
VSDDSLRELAAAAGLDTQWRDAFGKIQDVTPDTLRAVLGTLGFPAGTDADVSDSRARLAEPAAAHLPPLLVTATGEPAVAMPKARFRLTLEDGGVRDGVTDEAGRLPPVDAEGYHRLEIGGGEHTLAVAPRRCMGLDEAGAARSWGLAVQLYSLRRRGDGGLGDYPALRRFVTAAARHGADAVAISPVHAQFSADPDRFSPYAPSSRVMLSAVHVGCDLPGQADDALIDWPAATRARLARLRAAFDAAPADEAFRLWRSEQGEVLERHAQFEALHAHHFAQDPSRWHWREWPEAHRDPASPAVAAFASEHAHAVAFHAWLQFRAADELAAAQRAARAGGMRVGVISDLAVGTDSGGSHAWSRQDEMLIGLTIGAPPDLLGPAGQDWGLVAFSPTGLKRHGYAAFIEMLRAALRHAGGVRIDHVMGLARLWVMPEGAGAANGVYLRFPRDDLLRLIALESRRHRAIVLGEDLGTVPEGFQPALESAGVMGLRVLWFERDKAERFTPPATWTRGAVAMTSTHDLPTVAGWWAGRDLEWREGVGQMRDPAAEQDGRTRDRSALWDAMRASGAAPAAEPPATWDAWPVVDAAVAHLAGSACDLVLLPMEDALALPEQPNLPGTLDEHPNWRRRLPGEADAVLDDPPVAARLARLDKGRK